MVIPFDRTFPVALWDSVFDHRHLNVVGAGVESRWSGVDGRYILMRGNSLYCDRCRLASPNAHGRNADRSIMLA
jgi:hypothetical protein